METAINQPTDPTLRLAVEAISGERPYQLTAEQTAALLDRYPYFTLPAAALLKRDSALQPSDPARLDADTRRRLTRAVALAASDLSSLYILLESDADAHRDFYPDDTPAAPSTVSAIDDFLATYGSTSPEEEETLNRLIFNPVPDYAQMLAREEADSVPVTGEAEAGSNDDLINKFIIKQKQESGVIPSQNPIPAETVDRRIEREAPAPQPDDSLLSESLARIFIKQQQYERAFEIISQLNLNFPEKSVYFADQLRFLRKVMANRRLRESRQK